jgi:hypothetical protein
MPALVSSDLPFWAIILICLAGLLGLITCLICCFLVSREGLLILLCCKNFQCSHAPHNDVLVNDGLHIWQWFLKIIFPSDIVATSVCLSPLYNVYTMTE